MKKTKGYDIFDFDGTGMLEIEKLDSSDRFEDDEAAVEQAIKDGIKIIPVEELPENFERRYLGWIDTEENRKRINDFCNSNTQKEKEVNINKPYAVVFTYSFDSETPVYTFATEEEAISFLRESFKEEKRIDTEENCWDCEAKIEPDGRYAKIINHFPDGDDITEFHLGQLYL